MKKTFQILGWIALLAVLAVLAEELTRVWLYVFRQWGFAQGLLDGAVWYKLGEALVLVPFLLFLFHEVGSQPEARLRFVSRARWVMAAGALLNLLAWLDLRRRVPWSWWSLALLVLGLLLPVWMRRQAGKPRLAGRLLVALPILLLFALNFGVSYILTGYFFVPLPASPPPPAATQAGRWQQDLHYLASELPRLHVNAYHSQSKAEFDAAVDRLDRQIPSLSDAGVIAGMMRIVASVGDAHTSLLLPGSPTFHRYPLRAVWLRDGLFVTQTVPAYRQVLGARLARIGDSDVEDAYRQVSGLISHENESWLRDESPRYLATPEILQALGILPAAETGRFVLQRQDGSQLALDLPEIEGSSEITSLISFGKRANPVQWISTDEGATPLYRQQADQAFWFQILPEKRLLYFKYNVCSPIGFDAFNTSLWKTADQAGVQYLVVDLRGNGGGNSAPFDAFLRELKARPALDQSGRLFALIDRGTFSSAVLNAISLRQQTPAILLGEPSGGKPNGYGEVRTMRLPNSGLTVSYSTNYFQEVAGDPAAVFPDRTIEPSSADYFAGRDPVLDAVLQGIPQ